MLGTISPDVARAAVALRRSHPSVPALDVLEVVMRQRAGSLADFGPDQLDPGSPFGQLVAEAFDKGMSPAEWAVVNNPQADQVLVSALRSVWAREVLPALPALAAHYGLTMWPLRPSHPGSPGEPPGLHDASMTIIEKWRWRLRSSTTGKVHTTRYLMTEAEALQQDPAALRVPGSRLDIVAGAVPIITPSQHRVRTLPDDKP